MRILITGATGFVGRGLLLRLAREGHELAALVRSRGGVAANLGPDVALYSQHDASQVDTALAWAEGVIHLAGEPIIGKRWTAEQKQKLRDSRIAYAEALQTAAAKRGQPLQFLIGASAIGYYGNRGDEALDERQPPANDFAAQLCADWEAAELAIPADRHVIFRIGLVLGQEGGMLSQLVPVTKLGMGGPLGGGRQFQSWIHKNDLLEMLSDACVNSAWHGVYNATAPNPVRQSELMKALGSALGRPSFVPAPAFAVKLLFGEASATILASQRVLPTRALAQGFNFEFSHIDDALRDVVTGASQHFVFEKVAASQVPKSAYNAKRKPNRVLRTRTILEAPLEKVFPFFAAAQNLAAITPPSMGFRILNDEPIDIQQGTEIRYKVGIGPVRLTWHTLIEAWQPGVIVADAKTKGPYRAWWHEHHFYADGDKTIMDDYVYYAMPFGALGDLVHALALKAQLRKIFPFRSDAMKLRFAGSGASC